MHKLTRGERFKSARLDHNQHGKQTMDEVASATEISKSLIQALEDDEKERSVGYDKVAKLAAYYGVSANWLLGLEQDDPYLKPSTAAELGLTEHSISLLRTRHESPLSEDYYGLINDFIEVICSKEIFTDYLRICRIREMILAPSEKSIKIRNDMSVDNLLEIRKFHMLCEEQGYVAMMPDESLRYLISVLAEDIKSTFIKKYVPTAM